MKTEKEKAKLKERAISLSEFFVRRPVKEATEVLHEAFKQNKDRCKGYYHDYAEILRDFADFLDSQTDSNPTDKRS